MKLLVNPLWGKTINWRAGCGRSASPVRREGDTNKPSLPTPIFNTSFNFITSPTNRKQLSPPTALGGAAYFLPPVFVDSPLSQRMTRRRTRKATFANAFCSERKCGYIEWGKVIGFQILFIFAFNCGCLFAT